MALQELQLKISGMTCGHCEKSVASSIQSLDGIERVTVDHRTGLAIVRFENSKVTIENIKQAVNEDGIYTVTEVIYP
jgi:copper chaperone CopZ